MWAIFHRRSYPVADLTTNRIERSWWSIKSYLKTRFPSKPVIEIAIEAVVKMWEERFGKINKIKTKTIRHPNPIVSQVYQVASFHLNDAGMDRLLRQLEACFQEEAANEIPGVTTQSCNCAYYNL